MQSKERDLTFGLNWVNFGARRMNPTIGRMDNIDAMASKFASHSLYNYTLNNPLVIIDPDGNESRDIWGNTTFNGFVSDDGSGNFVGSTGGGGDDKEKGKKKEGGKKKTDEKSQNGNCPTCLDPSTIGKNLIGLSYPGGNNPKNYLGDYDYSYIPTNIAEYPAIGHDRRYDNLQIEGAKGLLTDVRAIGADWKFVSEQLKLASLSFVSPKERMQAFGLGVGLGIASFPKTYLKLLIDPNGLKHIIADFKKSNIGVSNVPKKSIK